MNNNMRLAISVAAITILQSALIVAQEPRIDLYALRQYRQYDFTDGELSSVACPDGCQEGPCIARGPYWLVEGECMRDGTGGSKKFSTVSGQICEQHFSDHECTQAADDGACVNNYAPECNGGSEQMTLFEDYCIKADGPSFPYTTQMIKGFSATSRDDCEGEVNVEDALLPGSNGICRPLPYSKSDGSFHAGGSGYSFCEGETMIRDVFSDATCSSQMDDIANYPNVNTACDGTDERGYLKTNDCLSPRIFCRDLSNTDFAISLDIRTILPGIQREIPTAAAGRASYWSAIMTATLFLLGLIWVQ